MSPPIVIDYYTDLLCVWAWIAQRRLDELHEQFGDQIAINHYYIDLFGDVAKRIELQWTERGSYEGFAQHVMHAVQPYDNATVNDRLWTEVRPSTSANAHMFIKAISLSYGQDKAKAFALTLRQAFFMQALDISQIPVLLEIAKQHGLEVNRLRTSIDNGTALAMLL
ncbi:disulfide bond formation protein DsbA, partial [Oleiphilus sp. HI0133]